MERLVDVLFARSRLVLAGWVLLTLAGGFFAAGLEGRAVPGGEASPSSQAEAVARVLSADRTPSLFVVVTGRAAVPDAAGRGELAGLTMRLAHEPGVLGVAPLPLPPPDRAAGPVTVLGVVPEGGVDGSIAVARTLLAADLAPAGSRTFLGGYGAHREELVELSQSDLIRAERLGLPIVAVVLLLTFGALWACVVPLAIGAAALLGGLGAAGALAYGVPFSEYVTNAASMVGLALAVDYAMFLVHRVREYLRAGSGVDDAIRTAMRTTGVAIAWSGLTVLAAESTMLLVDARSIRTASLGMMLVTAAAVVAALVGAPLVMRALGHRILPKRERLRALGAGPAGPGRSLLPMHRRERGRFWWLWGIHVVRHPVRWLLVGCLTLAAFCVPGLDLAQRVDLPSAAALPAGSQVRLATGTGSRAYGPGVLSPVEIVVRGSVIDAQRFASVLGGDPEVRAARTVPLHQPGLARVSVVTTHGPADPRTEALVRDLRSGPLHDRLGAALPGVGYEVGGEAALRVDATQALFDGLPLMLVALLVLVMVVFMAAMRSVVLPVKAALLVVLSLGAAAGGLVLLSTTGAGAALIGWSRPQDLHPIVPITVVAMVVALSTDYEVILISRIGEGYRQTLDNTRSIIVGVAHTGRVISSAAAIMVAVFAGFALSDVTPLRQLGVGLAVAVVLDATVVRGLLVPAGMQLMGRWNWWLPSLPAPRRVQPEPVPARHLAARSTHA